MKDINYGCTHELRLMEYNFRGQLVCSECRCVIYKNKEDFNYNWWSQEAVKNNKKFFLKNFLKDYCREVKAWNK